ncbi:hypothetical protein ACJX0J_023657, partial [Zea mays]
YADTLITSKRETGKKMTLCESSFIWAYNSLIAYVIVGLMENLAHHYFTPHVLLFTVKMIAPFFHMRGL